MSSKAKKSAAAEGERVLMGVGRLTWDRSERVGDRYGVIYLLAYGDSLSDGKVSPLNPEADKLRGSRGRLEAVVTETRESTHIGDIGRGVYPVTPEVGETISFGPAGTLVVERAGEGQRAVGIMPDDGRPDAWLDPVKLYRAHEQTVELYFVPEVQS